MTHRLPGIGFGIVNLNGVEGSDTIIAATNIDTVVQSSHAYSTPFAKHRTAL